MIVKRLYIFSYTVPLSPYDFHYIAFQAASECRFSLYFFLMLKPHCNCDIGILLMFISTFSRPNV